MISNGNSFSLANTLPSIQNMVSSVRQLGSQGYTPSAPTVVNEGGGLKKTVDWVGFGDAMLNGGIKIYQGLEKDAEHQAQQYLKTHSLDDYKKQVEEDSLPFTFNPLAKDSLNRQVGSMLAKMATTDFMNEIAHNKYVRDDSSKVIGDARGFIIDSVKNTAESLGLDPNNGNLIAGASAVAVDCSNDVLSAHIKVKDGFERQEYSTNYQATFAGDLSDPRKDPLAVFQEKTNDVGLSSFPPEERLKLIKGAITSALTNGNGIENVLKLVEKDPTISGTSLKLSQVVSPEEASAYKSAYLSKKYTTEAATYYQKQDEYAKYAEDGDVAALERELNRSIKQSGGLNTRESQDIYGYIRSARINLAKSQQESIKVDKEQIKQQGAYSFLQGLLADSVNASDLLNLKGHGYPFSVTDVTNAAQTLFYGRKDGKPIINFPTIVALRDKLSSFPPENNPAEPIYRDQVLKSKDVINEFYNLPLSGRDLPKEWPPKVIEALTILKQSGLPMAYLYNEDIGRYNAINQAIESGQTPQTFLGVVAAGSRNSVLRKYDSDFNKYISEHPNVDSLSLENVIGNKKATLSDDFVALTRGISTEILRASGGEDVNGAVSKAVEIINKNYTIVNGKPIPNNVINFPDPNNPDQTMLNTTFKQISDQYGWDLDYVKNNVSLSLSKVGGKETRVSVAFVTPTGQPTSVTYNVNVAPKPPEEFDVSKLSDQAKKRREFHDRVLGIQLSNMIKLQDKLSQQDFLTVYGRDAEAMAMYKDWKENPDKYKNLLKEVDSKL